MFKQSKNLELEKQTLQKLRRNFPNDDEALLLWQQFEVEELQRFFTHYRSLYPKSTNLDFDEFSNEEKALLETYFQQFLKKIDKIKNISPKDLYSFVYFFIFLSDFDHALQLMERLSPTAVKDWLHIELLLRNNKFAECLFLIGEAHERQKADPDFYATRVYSVAQCFWGLGEKEKAIELMQNLVQVKPDYRLSASLLKDWKESL